MVSPSILSSLRGPALGAYWASAPAEWEHEPPLLDSAVSHLDTAQASVPGPWDWFPKEIAHHPLPLCPLVVTISLRCMFTLTLDPSSPAVSQQLPHLPNISWLASRLPSIPPLCMPSPVHPSGSLTIWLWSSWKGPHPGEDPLASRDLGLSSPHLASSLAIPRPLQPPSLTPP